MGKKYKVIKKLYYDSSANSTVKDRIDPNMTYGNKQSDVIPGFSA